MSDKILDEFEGTNRERYCVTRDETNSGKCVRIHIPSKDSVGQPCWRQVFCSHPKSKDSSISRNEEQEAIHEVLTRYLSNL